MLRELFKCPFVVNLEKVGDCDHKHLADCLSLIREITSDASFHFAANEDILNDVCR